MDMQTISRKIVLTVAGNRLVTGFVQRFGMSLGAARFVAGESLEDAIEAARTLNEAGIRVTLDHLGESVSHATQATEAVDEYLKLLEDIDASGVDANVSLKLTQMGLDIDADLCLANLEKIVAKAKELDNFVRVDMEDSPVTQVTIDIFRRVHQQYGGAHIGLVVQAYLYRTNDDIAKLNEIDANLRICKGAYSEPPEVAFPKKADVDKNFVTLIEDHMGRGNYTAIATHDTSIIDATKDLAAREGISSDSYEFQMLYGIRPWLQKSLADEGYKVRAYVPYGRDWYPYFSRRLAERPANIWFFIGSLFRR